MGDAQSSHAASEAWELFLLGLRYRDSRLLTRGGNEPFALTGEDEAWLVYRGAVDVFAVTRDESGPVGARHHLFRAYANQLLLAVPSADMPVTLVASSTPDTQVLSFRLSRLVALFEKPENQPIIGDMIESWVSLLASSVVMPARPKTLIAVSDAGEVTLSVGDPVRSAEPVTWLTPLEGVLTWPGWPELRITAPSLPFPLAREVWLETTSESAHVRGEDTLTVLASGQGWTSLEHYEAALLRLYARDIQDTAEALSRVVDEQVRLDQTRLNGAVMRLASTWADEATVDVIRAESTDPLAISCQLIVQQWGGKIRLPARSHASVSPRHALAEIARASRLRVRTVLLRGDWWRRDNGPLLAYRGTERHPVALLAPRPGRYILHDPSTGEMMDVTPAVAEEVAGMAHSLIRPFPDRPLSARDLIRFGLLGGGPDLLRLLGVGLGAAALGLLIPIITDVIFTRLIPSGEQGQLIVMGIVLGLSAVVVALFHTIRALTLLRIEGRMDSAIQNAIWDRLLSLPPHFFRRYSAGELAQRVLGVAIIKQTLSGSLAVAILAGIFGWLNLGLILYYQGQLALLVLGFTIVGGVVFGVLARQVLRHQRVAANLEGQVSALVTQLMGGLSKLRVAGGEARAYALWATLFSQQKHASFKARQAGNMVHMLSLVFPLVATMAIFAVVYERTAMSTGRFLAFHAAFAQFMSATLQLVLAVVSATAVVPIYERLKPILQARPEVDDQKADPGELRGAIEVNHLTFRYSPHGPLVLNDVTFAVRPGQFVALVGASGSGKSTLLRHLLGFERPESGGVYYDGQALAEIDLQALRRQIGVVLQHSRVMTGTILDNIVGASQLGVAEAWEAAEKAGIAEDIRQLPMGMQTYVNEGGSTFSGGQRQRLLIARALVTNPRIIFFDEATSALDDRSQAEVTQALKQIDATRIVIAHRLSTIEDADLILVMERGQIVEQGTYRELMRKGGVFARLAQRQLV